MPFLASGALGAAFTALGAYLLLHTTSDHIMLVFIGLSLLFLGLETFYSMLRKRKPLLLRFESMEREE